MAAAGVAQPGDSSSRGVSGGSPGAGVAVQEGSPGILPSAPGMVTPEEEEGRKPRCAPAVCPEPRPRAQACSGDTHPGDMVLSLGVTAAGTAPHGDLHVGVTPSQDPRHGPGVAVGALALCRGGVTL